MYLSSKQCIFSAGPALSFRFYILQGLTFILNLNLLPLRGGGLHGRPPLPSVRYRRNLRGCSTLHNRFYPLSNLILCRFQTFAIGGTSGGREEMAQREKCGMRQTQGLKSIRKGGAIVRDKSGMGKAQGFISAGKGKVAYAAFPLLFLAGDTLPKNLFDLHFCPQTTPFFGERGRILLLKTIDCEPRGCPLAAWGHPVLRHGNF